MKQFIILSGTVAFLAATTLANATVLTNVPSAMGNMGLMKHVMFSYDAIQSKILVMTNVAAPQLTPLDVSHPGDSFDPADPWHTTLDPSERGLSFNNQFGFMYDELDERPADADIWIRFLASSPGVEFYRYMQSPKTWMPMFGTAGSTNLLQWNAMMFHPFAAAPAANGTHWATFEAFLANFNTGEPVPGIAPAQFTLHWTNVASSIPVLSIANAVVISWSSNATGYALQSAPNLSSTNWTAVTNVPVLLDGQNAVVLPPSEAMQVFRLISTPE